MKKRDDGTPDLFDEPEDVSDVDFPPYARGRITSFAAAERMAPITGRYTKLVYEFIFYRTFHGATCDEAEKILGLKHQTASSRIWELHRKNHIIDSGEKRNTRSGCKAIVWVVPPKI